MKKNITYCFIVCLIFIVSCNNLEVTSPNDFNVTIDKTVFKVGDTVTFKIQGNPDYIYYFSGDSGYVYENREISTAPIGKVTMSFTSKLTQGSIDSTKQQNTLKILISNNFVTPSPDYKIDSSIVVKTPATAWEDITSRFILPKVPGVNSINTGVVDITEFAVKSVGKPVYVALKYSDVLDSIESQRAWYITNFTIDHTLPNGTKFNIFYLINKSSNPLFSIINIKNYAVNWGIGSTAAQVNINGGPALSPDNEDWLITRALDLRYITPDKAIPVKSVADNIITQTKKVYRKSGTYNVVFIAKNQKINSEIQIKKELTITVEP